MFVNHCAQFLVLNKAEIPKVFTRFENQIADHSKGVGYTKLEEDAKVCGVVKASENSVYIFLKYADNTADVIHYMTTTRLTESYGFENIPLVDFDKLKVNTSITKDTILFHNNMYDDQLNMKYGVNLKAIFLAVNGLTFEDGKYCCH